MEEEIASIDTRWNELCTTVSDRLQTLENVQEEIHRYQVVLRVTEKTLMEIEQIVSVEYVLVLDPNKAKQDLAEVKVRKTSIIRHKGTDLGPLIRKPVSYEFNSHAYSNANQTHFHMKGFALGLVLKQRQKATRKWHVEVLISLVICIKVFFTVNVL